MVHDTQRTHERIAELHAIAREVRVGSQHGDGSVRPAVGTPSTWRQALGRRVLALGLAITGESAGPALRATR